MHEILDFNIFLHLKHRCLAEGFLSLFLYFNVIYCRLLLLRQLKTLILKKVSEYQGQG